MNIISTGKYPSNSLSNFAVHPFTFRGIEVASMEGFLQGLKFKNPDMQKHVFSLVGMGAKSKGKNKNWKRDYILYYQGIPIDRFSDTYQELLYEVYTTIAFESDGFQRALLASGSGELSHSIGRKKEKESILTQREFCSRLMWIRDDLKKDILQIKVSKSLPYVPDTKLEITDELF